MYWNRLMDPDSVYSAPRREKKLISLAYKPEDEVIVKVEEDLKEAAKNAGYDLTILYSNNSADIQLEQVREARKRGYKGIIVNLVTPQSAPAILEAAGDMKVVFIAHVPDDMSILNENAIYIGADQEAAGRLQGEWLANYFKIRGKDEIRYILLKGEEILYLTEERTQSALQALADNGIKAIPAVPPIIADYERTEATSKLLPILRSGVKFDAIISNDDTMALGAIEALEKLNMDPSKTVIVGLDATEPGVRALLEGKIAMTVYLNRKERAVATIKALDNMIAGKPFDQGMESLVSKDNPYAIIYPYEPVTRYHIPSDFYF
ncbi:sugar ABC transporter substrate-binding protein [Oscillospiraceae bacterium LTW-04]|nr:sugar ABC transporter substrate-binding protein [Oscillospiraceae bacterium MB24-C1]